MKKALILLIILSLVLAGCKVGPVYFAKSSDVDKQSMEQQKSLSELQTELDEINAKLDEVSVELESAKTDAEMAESEKAQLESEITILEEQYDQEKAELIAEQEAMMSKITCKSDSDCQRLNYLKKKYCLQGHSYKVYERYKCEGAGSDNAKCVASKEETEFKECEANKELCKGGECLSLSKVGCSDTDGGLNYFEKGKVVDALGAVLEDTCSQTNSNMLYERYCSMEVINGQKVGIVRTKLFPCSTLCLLSDYECLQMGRETTGPTPYSPQCRDGVCMDWCKIDETKPIYDKDNMKRCIKNTDLIDPVTGEELTVASTHIVKTGASKVRDEGYARG